LNRLKKNTCIQGTENKERGGGKTKHTDGAYKRVGEGGGEDWRDGGSAIHPHPTTPTSSLIDTGGAEKPGRKKKGGKEFHKRGAKKGGKRVNLSNVKTW